MEYDNVTVNRLELIYILETILKDDNMSVVKAIEILKDDRFTEVVIQPNKDGSCMII